jgi:peptide/nickel transport system substrate-binding protein
MASIRAPPQTVHVSTRHKKRNKEKNVRGKNSLIVTLSVLITVSAGLTGWAGGQAPAEEETPVMEEEAPVMEAAGSRFNEAPLLTQKVDKGELPPVDERLPQEPIIHPVFDEIGEYGGTLFVLARDPNPWQDAGDSTEIGPYYFLLDFDGNIGGSLMTGYEMSEDFKSITMMLRPGMKWSDGNPIVIEDILFTYNDMHNNPDVDMWNFIGSGIEQAAKLDEFTVRLDFAKPLPNVPIDFSGPAGGSWVGIEPFHYLKKWHADYNTEADQLAKEEGFDSWVEAFREHYWWAPLNDLDKPTIHPWILTVSDSIKKVMERNPYYPVVDPAGNQLPYIDMVVSTIVDADVYDLKIIGGEVDLAYLFVSFDNFTLFKKNEEVGDYTVYSVPGLFGSEIMLEPNHNHPDPVKNKLFNDKRFKIALSVAINRDEINEVVYSGQGEPRQATLTPYFTWFKPEWAQAHAEYDTAAANRLLDEVGMRQRGGDGFRLAPDGSPFLITIETSTQEIGSGKEKSLELIKEYWDTVGIKTQIKSHEPSLLWERLGLAEHDFAHTRPVVRITHQFGTSFGESSFAVLWGDWLEAQRAIDEGDATLDDYGGKLPGIEPPDWIKEHDTLFNESFQQPNNSREYARLMQRAFDNQAENLFAIGTVGLVPNLIVAKNYVRNVPRRYNPRHTAPLAFSEYTDQLYIKK